MDLLNEEMARVVLSVLFRSLQRSRRERRSGVHSQRPSITSLLTFARNLLLLKIRAHDLSKASGEISGHLPA